MVTNEKSLAKAIMRGDSIIDLSSDLSSAVIKSPSSVVWLSVISALIASSCFWSGGGLVTGMFIGLPAVLAISGGVGGIVFVVLGSKGTLCAFRLLKVLKTIEVLNDIRDKYDLNDDTLINKKIICNNQ